MRVPSGETTTDEDTASVFSTTSRSSGPSEIANRIVCCGEEGGDRLTIHGPPPAPPCRPCRLRDRDSAGRDRAAGFGIAFQPRQIRTQLRGALIAQVPIFLEQLADDPLDLGRKLRIPSPSRDLGLF